MAKRARPTVNTLVQRLFDARAKTKLQQLLKDAKSRGDVPRDAFRTTGDDEQLLHAVQAAVIDGHLSEAELARLVDIVEENGGQHIFLFNVSPAGRAALTPRAFARHFNAVPEEPDEAFYAEYPDDKLTVYEQRDDGIVVKQVFTTSYWEKNRDRSEETANRRIEVYDKVSRRSINMFVFDPATGHVEIRIDKVRGLDDKLATTMFQEFSRDLLRVVHISEHLVPVRVSDGFEGIIAARDETFMSVDEAFDASASMRFANRREEVRGRDIRDHPAYLRAVRRQALARETVRVYWLYENDKRLHSTISMITVEDDDGDREYGKVYVPAKLTPDELGHVIARVRHFAG
jgi:hypothetical protein